MLPQSLIWIDHISAAEYQSAVLPPRHVKYNQLF